MTAHRRPLGAHALELGTPRGSARVCRQASTWWPMPLRLLMSVAARGLVWQVFVPRRRGRATVQRGEFLAGSFPGTPRKGTSKGEHVFLGRVEELRLGGENVAMASIEDKDLVIRCKWLHPN